MPSTLLRSDGTHEDLTPINGTHWALEDLQALVGGYIEIVRTDDGRFLVIDEEGILKKKALNVAATMLCQHRGVGLIVGDAVVVSTKLELDGLR